MGRNWREQGVMKKGNTKIGVDVIEDISDYSILNIAYSPKRIKKI